MGQSYVQFLQEEAEYKYLTLRKGQNLEDFFLSRK